MTAFDRLLEQLPPELRAEAARILEPLGGDLNSPIFGLYAMVLATANQNAEKTQNEIRDEVRKLQNALTAAEGREKNLLIQIAAANTDQRKAVTAEIRNLSGDTPWNRIITNRIIGAAVWVVCVTAGTWYGHRQLLHGELAAFKQLREDQTTAVTEITRDPGVLVEYSQKTQIATAETLKIAQKLATINKMLTLPDAQSWSTKGGYVIAADESEMTVGNTGDGRNWVKFRAKQDPLFEDPEVPDTIRNAIEAHNKLLKSK